MLKGQTSIRNGIQDVLCPFRDWYCTQGANDSYSHKGSEANDIIGLVAGIKYPYYAPIDVKCVNIDKKHGFVWWQSVNKVRLADGSVDDVTFLCGHDNTINCYIGQVIKQGVQIGNMGNCGIATGIHCHIEAGRGKQTTWFRNQYGVYCIPNQIPLEKLFFMDNTNILLGIAEWKYLNDIVVVEKEEEYLNISNLVDTWRIYPLDKNPVKGNECGMLYPSKFEGLSYTIKGYKESNVAIIETKNFGLVQIYIGKDVSQLFSITNHPIYNLVN